VEEIGYQDGETALTALVVRPAGTPRAAVAVFPTIYNPTPGVIAEAEALASAGYFAVICDFYGTQPADMADAFAKAGALRADTDAYRARLRAGLAALDSQAGGLPRLAIGFCMGGQAVLELARDGADLAVVVSFHGLLDTGRVAAQPITPRILVCHGDADTLVPRSQVTGFWEEMDAVGAEWHFHSYSGVGHGFTNPAMLDGVPNPAYNSSADRQSWAAMLSLFDEVLG
jgi:dienelactone hydrolase